MPHRDTLHILGNFSRRENYNLYKEYVGDAQGNGISLHIHILQEHGKSNSTIFVFLRS